MPLLLTLAIIVVVLVVLVLLYLIFVPIVASFRAAACLTVAELAWGLVALRFRLEPGCENRLELLLLGLPIRLPLPKRAAPAAIPPGEAPATEAPPRSVTETLGRVLEGVGLVLQAWPDLQRLLVAVLRETRLRVRLGLVLGTGDAATTGETFGALMALRGIASAQPWFSLSATPVFDGPVFDWDADGEARVRSPIRVMVPAVRLFLRPEVRALARRARS